MAIWNSDKQLWEEADTKLPLIPPKRPEPVKLPVFEEYPDPKKSDRGNLTEEEKQLLQQMTVEQLVPPEIKKKFKQQVKQVQPKKETE